MKLLTKTTLFFLTISLFVIFTGGILFYFSFRYIMNQEVKRELLSEMHQFTTHLSGNKGIATDSSHYYLPVHYYIAPIDRILNPVSVFSDTMMVDKMSGQYQPFRKLTLETELNSIPVRISIARSLLFSDELIEYVVFVTLILSLILMVCIIFLNKYFFNRLWGNFLATTDKIKNYSISDTNDLALRESEIIEFSLLNQGFEKMHKRIRQDYQNLKEFIENISHEIQNPLAIIKSKIDLLQQNTHLDKSQAVLVQSIQGSSIRLSNLNRSLILLSKIDNNQFQVMEQVDIGQTIDFHIENFSDILLSKNISVSRDYRNPVTAKGDPDLISIMLLNLLKNSIFHNLPSGTVDILVEGKILTIKNSGKKLEISPEDIFKRFVKSSGRPDSLGLGLAIVKKICDYYNFGIEYTSYDKYHIIEISFR